MIIYADASFDDKRNIAGIGLHIEDGVKQRDVSNWIPCQDNNYAELWAIYLAGILSHGKKAKIITDSQTAISYIRGSVKEKPRTHEAYKKHQQMKVLAFKINRLGVNVEKVKAHTNYMQRTSIGNQLADILSKQGRSKFYER